VFVACSLTYHTLVVDKTLLQSTARDIARHKAAAEQNSAGGGGSGSNVGPAGSKLQRLATSLRSNMSGSVRRSASSSRWAAAQVEMAEPVSDNQRWQHDQAAQSV
jgi:hypothetical protein